MRLTVVPLPVVVVVVVLPIVLLPIIVVVLPIFILLVVVILPAVVLLSCAVAYVNLRPIVIRKRRRSRRLLRQVLTNTIHPVILLFPLLLYSVLPLPVSV